MTPEILLKPKNWIIIYTVVCILNKMRKQLGLEAMLEYLEKFQVSIEAHNPKLKEAVAQALLLMPVEKMYRDAIK